MYASVKHTGKSGGAEEKRGGDNVWWMRKIT